MPNIDTALGKKSRIMNRNLHPGARSGLRLLPRSRLFAKRKPKMTVGAFAGSGPLSLAYS